MKVKLWGVRGSLPSPHTPRVQEQKIQHVLESFFNQDFHFLEDIPQFLKTLPIERFGGYGGNTMTAEVKTPSSHLIIDGGSGIRLLGYELMSGACGQGRGEIHLLMTHFHWDHLMGLPFFAPLFIPHNSIIVYSVNNEAEKAFRTVFQKPYFPVPFEQLGATIKFVSLSPREPKVFGDLTVTPFQLDHPDPCWGFRMVHEGRTLSYCVDTEATRVSREKLGADLPLYQDVDVLVFDAQYTMKEALEKVNWGHAAANIGLDLALREGIRRVYFVHHDPAASDAKVAEAEALARDYFETQLKNAEKSGRPINRVEWCFAQEGTEFTV